MYEIMRDTTNESTEIPYCFPYNVVIGGDILWQKEYTHTHKKKVGHVPSYQVPIDFHIEALSERNVYFFNFTEHSIKAS